MKSKCIKIWKLSIVIPKFNNQDFLFPSERKYGYRIGAYIFKDFGPIAVGWKTSKIRKLYL